VNILNSTKADSTKAHLAKTIGVLAVIASFMTISEQNQQETQTAGRCAPFPICTLIIAEPTGPVIEQMLIDEAAREEQQRGKTKQS
jgi:hypothetical protein